VTQAPPISLSEFLSSLAQLEQEAIPRAQAAATEADLEAVRVQYLGRESGAMRGFVVAALPPADRREGGQRFNETKQRIEREIGQRSEQLAAQAAGGASATDLTMPSRRTWLGGRHPVSIVIDEIEDIFRELGFTVVLGPEAETEWYNFGSLNFPRDHPAMDLHDTLYIGRETLLRTHTSPVQVRTLQRFPPPIRVLVPGNVYRRDFFDASHAPMFTQIEGLCIDEGISFVDLKATLSRFAERLFGASRTRFRPSFFPFTEPSAEMDVQCGVCGGSGCATCKGSGWIEILGSGMVHPSVLEAAGVDSERYTGWAFGMGPARTALARYGIPDIRLFYDSDVRFLEQLAR
jgi:phenylalanyl-tRNA synthetase alpha chain